MKGSNSSPQSPEAFASLITAAREAAPWAWKTLLDDIDPTLRAYVTRLGAADVDDVIGETWLHVARGVDKFEGDEAAFRSWVFMIAHHRIIDERRRRSRKPAEPTEVDELEAASDVEPSAEAEAMSAIEDGEVREILGRLPLAQREVMILRIVGGFGITEIASIIGKRPGAVQALQHRAVNRLRKELGPPPPGA